MAWSDGSTTGQGSTRATRKAAQDCIAAARGRCELRHAGCTRIATQAHHSEGLADTRRARRDAVDHGRLIAACPHCHGIETRKQARRGRNRWKRPAEQHPGLLRPR